MDGNMDGWRWPNGWMEWDRGTGGTKWSVTEGSDQERSTVHAVSLERGGHGTRGCHDVGKLLVNTY